MLIAIYNNHAFHPFLNKYGIINRVHQTIKKVKIDVINTSFGLGSHRGKHICINAVITYPPKIPADSLANFCQGDFVKYLGFAGIF